MNSRKGVGPGSDADWGDDTIPPTAKRPTVPKKPVVDRTVGKAQGGSAVAPPSRVEGPAEKKVIIDPPRTSRPTIPAVETAQMPSRGRLGPSEALTQIMTMPSVAKAFQAASPDQRGAPPRRRAPATAPPAASSRPPRPRRPRPGQSK